MGRKAELEKWTKLGEEQNKPKYKSVSARWAKKKKGRMKGMKKNKQMDFDMDNFDWLEELGVTEIEDANDEIMMLLFAGWVNFLEA